MSHEADNINEYKIQLYQSYTDIIKLSIKFYKLE